MAGVRFPDGASLQIPASVAQLAARGSHNPKVVGSKPTGGILIVSAMLLWRSWQRIGLMSRWSRVRAPAGAAFLLNARSKIVTEVGFEPTPPKRLVPKTSALDHSATQPDLCQTWDFINSRGGLAQSVECVVRNDEAPGSKPGFSMVIFCYQPIPHSLVG